MSKADPTIPDRRAAHLRNYTGPSPKQKVQQQLFQQLGLLYRTLANIRSILDASNDTHIRSVLYEATLAIEETINRANEKMKHIPEPSKLQELPKTVWIIPK